MKVSIIIPIYNVAPYIKNCLLSVFNQTYKELEIILIDDCGTDKSMEIAKNTIAEYGNRFSIKIIRHPHNKGLSAARNTGVKEATGDYIYFLDSDDTLPNTSISNLMEKAKKYQYPDFIIGGIKATGIEERVYPLSSNEYLDNNKEILEDYMLFKWNVMACNKLINRNFLIRNNLTFTEKIYHEDIDFTFQLATCAKSMSCCHKITYNYLIREKSITANKILKNYIDEYNIHKHNLLKLLNPDYKQQEPAIISKYAISICYNFTLSLIIERNKNIKRNEKKELINNLIQVSQKIISNKHLSPPFLMKNIYLKLPFLLQYPIAYIYLGIKNRI